MSVDVAVLGATGLVGERLVHRLAGHPYLRLCEVVASEGSAGGTIAGLRLLAPDAPLRSRILLSALPREAALELEPEYASRGHLVCSNASAFRADARVPLLVPEINPQRLQLLEEQPWAAAGGGIVTNCNCVVAGLAMALAPLHASFGLAAVTVVTMQALSGAGRKGIAAWELLGNVIPYIEGEAEKIPAELCKILEAQIPVSVAVNRVPVLDGHLASVFVRLRERASLTVITAAMERFSGTPESRRLPSAPVQPLRVLRERERPQPRIDLDAGTGMTVSVGGLASDPAYDARFTVLVHNLVRGAAGACLLNAELLAQRLGQVEGPAGPPAQREPGEAAPDRSWPFLSTAT